MTSTPRLVTTQADLDAALAEGVAGGVMTVSPEVQAHADRRKLTRAARAWMATFVLGALLWAGLIFAGLNLMMLAARR